MQGREEIKEIQYILWISVLTLLQLAPPIVQRWSFKVLKYTSAWTFNHRECAQLKFMVSGQSEQQTYTHNTVTLVWGSLRLTLYICIR